MNIIMDKTTRGTKVSVDVRSLKHVVVQVNKAHAQVTVFTFIKLGSRAMGEIGLLRPVHPESPEICISKIQ
jgi:hypothetical protein